MCSVIELSVIALVFVRLIEAVKSFEQTIALAG
jgi:hypothetical protein